MTYLNKQLSIQELGRLHGITPEQQEAILCWLDDIERRLIADTIARLSVEADHDEYQALVNQCLKSGVSPEKNRAKALIWRYVCEGLKRDGFLASTLENVEG